MESHTRRPGSVQGILVWFVAHHNNPLHSLSTHLVGDGWNIQRAVMFLPSRHRDSIVEQYFEGNVRTGCHRGTDA
ncbi:hypothetical protein D3C85_1474040 [compost metagenome]